MSQFLELTNLSQGNRVPQMDVDAGRVDAVLHAERLAGLDAALKLVAQLRLGLDLVEATFDESELFFDRLHDVFLCKRA